MHRVLSSTHKLQTAEQNRGCHFALRWHSDFYLRALQFHSSSHIPDEKGVGDKKFNSIHQMFSTGGHGQLGMRLYMYLASLRRRGRRKSTWYTLFAHAHNYSKGHVAELGACTNMKTNGSHE